MGALENAGGQQLAYRFSWIRRRMDVARKLMIDGCAFSCG